MMPTEPKKHSIYARKLKEIGQALGLDTDPQNSATEYYRAQYHLANPDCVWYRKVDRRLKDEGILPDDAIPVVVFEVLYAEKEKAMRGSLLSLSLRNPFRGVLVLLREEDKSDEHFEERKKYLSDLLAKTRYDNVSFWLEQDVDKLYERLVKPK